MTLSQEAAGMAVTVVDDEPLALDVLLRATRSWNFECQSACTAEQALQVFARRPTPILVTDLRMPGKGGVWLVREILQRWPDCGIIVVTAGDDNDAAIECLNAGADRYFLKPIKLEEFRHALETTMQTWRLKHERELYRIQLEEKVREQTHRIRSNFLSTIDTLICSLEHRDAYTVGHSHRVRRYSVRMAKALGLPLQKVKRLSLAAKLHDIGKFSIPEAILNKPGRLTAAEDQLIRAHPADGERIIGRFMHNREILAAIRGHHERMDGGGYPDGLQGGQIPLLARIITVADCFDALTSSRAYRPAVPKHQAAEFLQDGAGTHFDPKLVRIFVEQVSPLPQHVG